MTTDIALFLVAWGSGTLVGLNAALLAIRMLENQ